MAKTSPSHGEGRGSIPLRVTIAYIGVLTAFLTYGITLRKDVCLYIFFPSAYVFKQFAAGEENLILRNCVTAARQTLTLFVRVQILLPQPTKKELLSTKSSFFVYPSRRLGISLTHEVRHISSRAARRPCISSRAGVYLYTRLRLDDIQCFALMIYRNKLRMIYTPSA